MNTNPFDIIPPSKRWKPQNQEQQSTIAPLVQKVREAVAQWRHNNYKGASETSVSLLNYWFNAPHRGNFRFYFSQREAIESIIYLYEVVEAKDKYELVSKFDITGTLNPNDFTEHWTRYVVKMATGAGKTKVAALVIVWAYFHKLYETGSPLSKNFLVIAPNIIVFNRLLKDFEGLRMFFDEPFLPEDG
jgi:type III restriction enzyme